MASSTLPNLLIAGVHKAGTTSLFSYLTSHPEICGAATKEVHHYTPLRYGMQPEPLESYAAYFSACSNSRYRLDASPSYLYLDRQAIQRLNKELEDPKIIFILREPTARFQSYYRHCISKFRIDTQMTFDCFTSTCFERLHEALEDEPTSRALREGNYHEYLPAWFEGKQDKIRIIFFEDFILDPRQTILDLCEWLQIDSTFYEGFHFEVENKTVASKNKSLFKLAQRVNKKFEQLWRRNPQIKRIFRNLYYKLNGKKVSSELDLDSVNKVKEYYKNELKQLETLLQEKNVSVKTPRWSKNK